MVEKDLTDDLVFRPHLGLVIVQARFGTEFLIRFDFRDTRHGNWSLQRMIGDLHEAQRGDACFEVAKQALLQIATNPSKRDKSSHKPRQKRRKNRGL